MNATPVRDCRNPRFYDRVVGLRPPPAPLEKSRFPLAHARVRQPLNPGLSRLSIPAGSARWRNCERHSAMNKVFLSGRITSDISRFGTDSKGGVSFSLVTSKPVIKAGQIQKDENGYTETYDAFHPVTAFNGLGKSAAHKQHKSANQKAAGQNPYT